MITKRMHGLGGCVFLLAALVAGCTGPAGPPGKDGTNGTNGKDGTGGSSGSLTPSVSAVSPSFAYLGRTLDLTIAGNGTNWSSATTVAFADSKVKVNKVTAASTTGLVVNVTVGPDATVAATDVTVTDGANMEVYKGAFEIKSPLSVTTDQTGGIPQGGFAFVTAQMLDTSTPLDPSTATVVLSATDVAEVGTPTVSDFSASVLVGADVLATVGESVDLVVSSGATGNVVDSPAKAAFKVAARTPTTLSTAMEGSGMLNTTSDSTLYQFTPSAASARFVQFSVASADGGAPAGMAVPKSGKLAQYLSFFGIRYGMASTSTDPTYLIVTDSGSIFANPPPYSFTANVSETACTAVTEQTGAHADFGSAQAVTTLPALVTGDLTMGSSTPDDWYSFTVSGASAGSPLNIHVATGGDGLSDISVNVVGADGSTSLATDAGDDYHKDVVASSITKNGTYYVQLAQGANFNPTHSTYVLFVEVK